MPNLTITDWRKGITDDIIGGREGFSKMLNNLYIDTEGRLVQRDGIDIHTGLGASGGQLPSGNQAVDSLYYFDLTYFAKSGTELYYLEVGDTAWTNLDGPAHSAFSNSEVGAGASWSEWRGHLFITPMPTATKTGGHRTVKVYRNSSGDWTCVEVGMPPGYAISSLGAAIVTASGDNFNGYAFYHKTYTAKVDGVNTVFKDHGAPTYNQFINADFTDAYLATPVSAWSNGTHGNQPTLCWYVYRTKLNESTPLLDRIVTDGNTLDFSRSDANLGKEVAASGALPQDDGGAAYFTGGVSYWMPPPLCYYSIIIGEYAFYAAGTQYKVERQGFTEMNTSRFWQSHPGNPNAVPAGNFSDCPVKITGVGAVGQYPIVFGESRAYRVEGRFDAFGNGGMVFKPISFTEGCVSARGIVRTEDGLFFPSGTGFCFTDGFKVWNVTKHLRTTYAQFLNKSKITGAYDSLRRRVYYAVTDPLLNTGYSSTTNNQCMYILDRNHMWVDERGDQHIAATTAFNDNAMRYHAMFIDSTAGVAIFGHVNGYLFGWTAASLADPGVNTSAAHALWGRIGISWKWQSCHMHFGSSTISKWFMKMSLIASNLVGKFSCEPTAYVNKKTTGVALTEIRERDATTTGLHKVWRWFKRGVLRGNYLMLSLEKASCILLKSDDYALVSVNSGTHVVTLASGSWPTAIGVNGAAIPGTNPLRNLSISFSGDSYAVSYGILTQSGGALTLSSSPAGNPTGQKWVITGYPKDEPLELHSVDVEYDVDGEVVAGYETSDVGSNA